jgi:hypothetical protein
VLLLVAAVSWTYDEPTDEELAGWWESLTTVERLAEIRKLDQIEHAQPELTEPRLVIVQVEDGTIHSYFDGPLGIGIAGHLQYEIELPSAEGQGTPVRRVWTWFGAGAAAGALVVLGLIILAP